MTAPRPSSAAEAPVGRRARPLRGRRAFCAARHLRPRGRSHGRSGEAHAAPSGLGRRGGAGHVHAGVAGGPHLRSGQGRGPHLALRDPAQLRAQHPARRAPLHVGRGPVRRRGADDRERARATARGERAAALPGAARHIASGGGGAGLCARAFARRTRRQARRAARHREKLGATEPDCRCRSAWDDARARRSCLGGRIRAGPARRRGQVVGRAAACVRCCLRARGQGLADALLRVR